jgi:DNA polymerase-3 subunit delta
LRAFEKHLEGSAPLNFSPVYMILGKDGGDRRLALDTLIAALRRAQPQEELALRSFQGDAMKAADLARELDTFSFFSPKEIVVVHDADALKKETAEMLTRYFQKTNPRQTLILAASALLHTTNFYKQAEKTGVVLEFAEEKPWEREKSLAEWAAQAAAAQGKRLPPRTAEALVKHVGLDRATLTQELDKAICFCGERPEITPQDILTICTPGFSSNEWQLGEAIMRLDPSAALQILRELLLEGTPIFSLLRQLRSQLQTGCQTAWILAGGGGADGVAREFPYLKGRLLDQKVQLAQTYGLSRFKKGLQLIDEAEIAAKNGMDDHALLADLTIIKLTR